MKPDDEVTDFRTAVTGHTAEDLASVRYTREVGVAFVSIHALN